MQARQDGVSFVGLLRRVSFVRRCGAFWASTFDHLQDQMLGPAGVLLVLGRPAATRITFGPRSDRPGPPG